MIITIKLDDKTKQQLVTWYNNHAEEEYALANPEALFFELVGRKVLHNDLVFEIRRMKYKKPDLPSLHEIRFTE
jgi:hypothetical protein